ncbi:short-chain dehydorgenase/reductase [Arthrobacter nitrophenolicus]|uniref:Short-chain dehydorgenase/reductase n=1 Tax=Arthrobacter nitrophenolicus TaxID=683150 RepID=L8TQH9_9MICC|nr:SDR family NAD(P)-dependent oxidoreductase [Arthrobacter nitrophenolicus]ELT44145.1 short-chain dehydorgenase/reductase [Arthrobacter nitrophenolicus]
MSRFKDQVALITGSGRGIGRATALKFAEEGALVLINDLHQESADAVVAEINSLGGNAAAAGFDITDREGAAKAVQQIVEDHGPSTFWSTMQAARTCSLQKRMPPGTE